MDLNQQILRIVEKLEPDHKARVLNFAKYLISEYYTVQDESNYNEDNIEYGFVSGDQINWNRIDRYNI